jgi:hypothetical protein
MEELSAYLAGDLDEELRLQVHEALEADPELQASLEKIERSLKFLKEHAPLAAPEGLHDAVMAAIADEPLHGGRDWYRATLGAVVLAAAAATLLVVLPETEVDQQGPEEMRTAPADLSEVKKEAKSREIEAEPARMPAPRPATAQKKKAVEAIYPALDKAPPAAVSAAPKPAARPAPSPLRPAEDEEEEDAPVELKSELTEGIGGLIGAKGTQIGAGGLGSRSSGLGGGGTSESLGGLGSRGIGSGRSGYGTAQKAKDALPGVTTSAPIILGALDRSLIDGVVKKHMNQIRYCYERELGPNPTLGGKIVIKSIIGKDGAVSEASVDSSTMGNARVEECVVQRFMGMDFPQPKGGGIVIVSYPFEFSPP